MPFARHFFRHVGVPALSDELTAALIDAVEEDMRRSGELGDDEAISIRPRGLGDLAKQDPALAERKRNVIRVRSK